MRKSIIFGASLALLAFAGTLTSCSDDDNNTNGPGSGDVPGPVTPTAVFTQGLPTQFGGYTITTDSKGLVSQMADKYGDVVTFEYPSMSRENDADVIIKYANGGNLHYTIYCQLNSRGFISSARQVYTDSSISPETWEFGYDSSDRLVRMVRSEGGNETTTITYVDGDIVATSTASAGETDSYEVVYTNDTTPVAIANTGGVMLFDQTFGVDLDEMDVAYFAGMLGKSTAHLPLQLVNKNDAYDVDTFVWTLNASGMPVKMTEDGNSEFIFVW